MKSTLYVKKLCNLIKVMFSYYICSGIKSQKSKKVHLALAVLKTFDFSQNFFVPFHRTTFDYSISCVTLIDES